MAAGTQISASVSPSSIGTLSGNGVSFTMSCGCSNVSNAAAAAGPPWNNTGPSTYCPSNSAPAYPYSFYVNFAATGAAGSQGAITISVTTPGTKITSNTAIGIQL
jgi:hypothetical protein